ncbi:MAG: ABC transporter permease [Thermoanaerobaculia bacterium]
MSFPLLRRELVGLLRTRRAFWLLVLTAAAASLVPLLAWPREGGSMLLRDESEHRMVLYLFFCAQLGAALISVTAFSAGAIAGERERGTVDLLRSALVPPLSIVAAKALAPMGYALFLLAACVPVACLFYLLGGISFGSILRSCAVTFAAVISAELVCLVHSLRSRRTAQAAIRAVFWVFFWNLGLLLLLQLAALAAREFEIGWVWLLHGRGGIEGSCAPVFPFEAIERCLEDPERSHAPMGRAGALGVFAAVQGAGALGVGLVAALLVGRSRGRDR